MAIAQPTILFDEILDFLASTPTPQQIIAFKPSDNLQERLDDLLERNRQETLMPDEREELNEFLRMNHFMNMLVIRARQKLSEK
jgi:hypothetical protein